MPRRIPTILCFISATFVSAELAPRIWTIDGDERTALVWIPDFAQTDEPLPLILGFHGHGGTAQNAARRFRQHELWPEAIVVYPQGLPTIGRLTDPEGKRAGWQQEAGLYDDRDLRFVDEIIFDLAEEVPVDPDRIYSTGHSNGAGFTYLLWAARPGLISAIAPSAGGARGLRELDPHPVPVLHLAGTNDPLVRIEGQRRLMQWLRRFNLCAPNPVEWAEGVALYPSPQGTPVLTYVHDGGHRYRDEAPELIARFFREAPSFFVQSSAAPDEDQKSDHPGPPDDNLPKSD